VKATLGAHIPRWLTDPAIVAPNPPTVDPVRDAAHPTRTRTPGAGTGSGKGHPRRGVRSK
jgi:hypothetical protein